MVDGGRTPEGLDQELAVAHSGLSSLPGDLRVIWEKTTVPQSWLAEKLMMGSPANVIQQLRRNDLHDTTRSLPRDLGNWLALSRNVDPLLPARSTLTPQGSKPIAPGQASAERGDHPGY